jgi:hypothetical protein
MSPPLFFSLLAPYALLGNGIGLRGGRPETARHIQLHRISDTPLAQLTPMGCLGLLDDVIEWNRGRTLTANLNGQPVARSSISWAVFFRAASVCIPRRVLLRRFDMQSVFRLLR